MKDELIDFLNTLNEEFSGKLFQQETIIYASKLLGNAELICHYSNSKLVGCIAFYANDDSKNLAFISFIGIHQDYRSIGLGKILLDGSISYLKRKNFKLYGLEVISENSNAINFYLQQGFVHEENRGDKIYMIKKL